MGFVIVFLVIVCIALLLYCRIYFVISYEHDFVIKIRYLFIVYRIKSKEQGKNKKAEDQNKKNSILVDFLRNYKLIYNYIKKTSEGVRRGLIIKKIEVHLTVCAQDAAETAVRFGEANAVVYTGVSVLDKLVRIRKRIIKITPDFYGTNTKIDFKFVAGIRLGKLIAIALSSFKDFMSYTRKIKIEQAPPAHSR